METPSSGNKPIKLHELSDDVLQTMSSKIDEILVQRQEEAWRMRVMSEEDLQELFRGFGYETSNRKVWRVTFGKHRGNYGLQVGSYLHSCHIESTSFIVLLLCTNRNIQLMQFSEDSLEGPITLP